jgi:hypothetical protein
MGKKKENEKATTPPTPNGDVLEFDDDRARDVVERGLAEYATPQDDGKTHSPGDSGTDEDLSSDNESQNQKTNGDETEKTK